MRVTIVQRVLPHYRVPFFARLHDDLAARNIALRLVYGDERSGTVPRTTRIDAPWVQWIDNRYFVVRGREIVWQPALAALRHSSLIVLEQASRLLINHVLMTGAFMGDARLAFWGHGKSFQSGGSAFDRVGASLARAPFRRADWFFAYTEHSLPALEAAGFPLDRTTVVRNSIDTRELSESVAEVTAEQRARLRAELGIAGENVALYCGGMYPNKRIRFLLDACERVQAAVPDFHLVLVGDGPDEKIVRVAAARHPWVHHVGAKFGRDRAPYFAISKALLMPGAVGLVVVDAFAARCPMVTTNLPIHGPEISYLKPNVNGLITPDNLEAYAAALIELLNEPVLHGRLVEGCAAAANETSIEAMSRNFTEGVVRCLYGTTLDVDSSLQLSAGHVPRAGD